MKIMLPIIQFIVWLISTILMATLVVLIIAMPLLIIFAIYKAAKGLMTHNANLKNQRDNEQ